MIIFKVQQSFGIHPHTRLPKMPKKRLGCNNNWISTEAPVLPNYDDIYVDTSEIAVAGVQTDGIIGDMVGRAKKIGETLGQGGVKHGKRLYNTFVKGKRYVEPELKSKIDEMRKHIGNFLDDLRTFEKDMADKKQLKEITLKPDDKKAVEDLEQALRDNYITVK